MATAALHFMPSTALEGLARRLLALLDRITGLESTYLTMVDWDGDAQEVLFARNTGALQIPEGLRVDWADTLCRRALEGGPRCTSDVASVYPDSAAARELGITTYVTVPVIGPEGEVFGTLCGTSARAVQVSLDALAVMETLAEMIALQLERDTAAGTLAELAHRLRDQTLHDPLTGLPNRVMFTDRLDEACAQQVAGSTALLFIDLDDFKAVNDTGGHGQGDQLLLAVGERLRDITRSGDTVARLSGDEFALILCGIDAVAGATAVAERVIAALSEAFTLDGTEVHVRASVGVAVRQDPSIDASTLLHRADMAMYAAKRDGKGRYRVFDDEVQLTVADRAELEADLHRAVADGQFVIHYQPIVNLHSDRVEGMEALLRWDHPVRGLLPPNEFIGLAEETGVIVPLGAWVLRQACAATAAWNAQHPGEERYVSVNVSPRQLSPDLTCTVADALAAAELEPSRLVVEMTEALYISEPEGGSLRLLRDLGVRVAIDDFGTGYSALNYLRRFPIDIVKIDRTFVHPDVPSADDAAILQAIVAVCRVLRLDMIAEGVETAEEAARLRRLGVDRGQGFHFGRPLPLV